MYFTFHKIKSSLLTAVFLLFIIPGNSVAQELKFSHITADQGLSVGVVNCVFQDSRGFMWFGTQDGLNKYDGYNITIFKHNPVDSNSLSNNFVYALYEDKNGVLWIGTNGGGLDEYNLSTQTFKHHPGKQDNINTLSNNTIRAILEDNEGLLWLGTDDGLNSYDRKTGKFTRYLNDPTNPNSLSNNNAWCLHQSKDGRLWIGTHGGGLNSFDKKTKKFRHYTQSGNNYGLTTGNINNIRSIYEDKNGVFWIGTDGDGITLFDKKSAIFFKNIWLNPDKKNDLVKTDRIMSITEDADNMLWIATYGNGISLYNKKTGRFKNLISDDKNPEGLNNNQIKCIYHDKTGSVWVGTEGGGVNAHFRGSEKFKYYKKRTDSDNDLKSNIVFALLEDSDGLLWIGTGHGGLTTLDRKTDTYRQHPALSTSSNNSVLALHEDKDGIIWVGTWGAGLNSYDKKTKKITTYPELKASNSATILCIYQDTKGLIWIATYNAGVFVYDKLTKKFKNYSIENGLSSNTIYSFFEDSKNNMWIATDGGGLNKYNPSNHTFKTYVHDKNNSISSNSVNVIYEDKQGIIWLGTSNGLNKLNPSTEHVDQFFEKDGLPNDYIYCILPDKEGNLWISTNKGVSKFNPSVKNENGSAFRNYDINDGLQGMEFNQGAYFQNTAGEIFLGGTNGFNVFNPEKIKDNPHIPSVRIISFKRFGKEVPLDTAIYDKKYIQLSWRDNFFSFDFASLDYQMPSKNKYSYKLEGVNDEWSPPSTQRYASYTQLGGGDYIFRVRASNNDTVWNNEGVALYIRIIPPFWKTKWFFLLCILITIGGFAGFVTYRTSTIKRENRILEEKVEERTLELEQKNKDITSSIQYAKRIQLAILPPLEQVFNHFPESFVFYKPKDIVSGDFYWFGIKNGKKIIATVDCTGHGVPGAFMSMIGHNLLNQIISENGITEPGLILNALHNGVQNALKQGSNVVDTSDGMDVALCTIDTEKHELSYAGAYRPLFLLNKDKFEKIDATKHSIGGSQLDPDRQFLSHTFKINKGDTIYLSSDGYADQFGGEKGKKFMLKRFNELLLSIQGQTMPEQAKTLDDTLEAWRGSYQQVDDILVIGIRF